MRRGGADASLSDTPTLMRDTPLLECETSVVALCNGGEYQFDIPCVRADIGSLPMVPDRTIAGRAVAFRPHVHWWNPGVDNPVA
jgi:hypothetical protein